MQHETVSQMFKRYHDDKKNGVKHMPLHTLQECCEEAGIDPRMFGRYAAQFPGAPQPAVTHGKTLARSATKYYRKHEVVQWVKQIRQQKEKAMPDIKTALEKALAKTANAWAEDDLAHQQIKQQDKPMTTSISATSSVPINTLSPTPPVRTYERNNVSRITFEYIRDNPGLTVDQVTSALVEQGFKENSVSSLCYQMMRVRLVVADANGKLTSVVQQYAPIQLAPRKRKAKPAAKTKAKPTAKPVVDAAPAPAPTRIQRDLSGLPLLRKHVEITNTRTGEVINPRKEEWSVESVIGSLNVRQAMAVYDELRKIFGA
jgi:hypothetical protein